MAITYSFPGPTGLATTTDGRKDLAGLVETDTTGAVRSGIFPAHPNALVSARTDMNVDVAAFQACAVQFGGPILFANDGVAQLGAALVSPASGNNYYVVYGKQNESVSPGTDANNNRILSATLSTASFAAARATLPAGAVELATVLMPTGKTATNQSGVTITATHQFTAADGGVVWVRNAPESAAWNPADGSQAWQMDIAAFLVRAGGVWDRAVQRLSHAEYTTSVTGLPDNTSFSAHAVANDAAATTDSAFTSIVGSALRLQSGLYSVEWVANLSTPATGTTVLALVTGGSVVVAQSSVSAGTGVGSVSIAGLLVTAANTDVTFVVSKIAGGSSNMTGRVRVTKTSR